MVTKKTSDDHQSRMFVVFCKHKLRDGRPAARSRPASGPRRQRSTRVGLLFCFSFVLARTPVAIVELLGCKPFSFEVRTWFKASPCRSVPFLGSRAVVPLSESFQISFRDPEPTRPRTSQLAFHATCLHGCCARSRLSHARRRVTSLCAHKSRSMRTGLLVGPLCGALDPLVGRCWAMVPLGLHLCLVKPHPTCLGTVRHLYRRPCIWGVGWCAEQAPPGGRWSG